jgi:hypothetical protein
MKIYYTSTAFNKKLVQAARERIPGSHEFHPLSRYGAYRRQWQLRKIDEPSVFIWGSGWDHHESHYFTGKKVKAKIGIDQHSDDLEYSRGERVKGLKCFNHMRASAKLGVETISISSSRGDALLIPENFRSGKTALTVDFDCIPFFPASPIWALTDGKGGFPLEAVVKFVGGMKPNAHMLDIGGVAENSPDFTVGDNARAPTQSEISEYCYGLKTRQPIEKNIANTVLNYALGAYIRVLEAFLDGWR